MTSKLLLALFHEAVLNKLNGAQEMLESAGGRVVDEMKAVRVVDEAPALLLAEPEHTQEDRFLCKLIGKQSTYYGIFFMVQNSFLICIESMILVSRLFSAAYLRLGWRAVYNCDYKLM